VSSVAVAAEAAAIDFCSRGRGFSLIVSFSEALADSFLSKSSCFEEWNANHTKAPKRITIETINGRGYFHIFNIGFLTWFQQSKRMRENFFNSEAAWLLDAEPFAS
jgi:hypothetical protein